VRAMIDKPHWEVPDAQQPRQEEVGFDLDRTLRSVVNIEAEAPADAFTAGTLGQERAGSGIVIRDTGLVLTIGYLVTEAESVVIIDDRGRATPAHPIAIDQESGFALVQAMGDLDLPAVPLGVVAKQEFSGYWEYHINDALFTAPAHPLWGGAGLIGPDGRLIGVGSLHVQQSDGRGHAQDVNMSVPI